MDDWKSLQQGINCHLCPPRKINTDHHLEIASLTISTLYLFRDQRFRGYSLLIFDGRHAATLEELTDEEYHTFMTDLRSATQAIRNALQPDHMNYECLGNLAPHLHWHIIPRYEDDPRWGRPVWEGDMLHQLDTDRFLLSEGEYQEIIAAIRALLPKPTGQSPSSEFL